MNYVFKNCNNKLRVTIFKKIKIKRIFIMSKMPEVIKLEKL